MQHRSGLIVLAVTSVAVTGAIAAEPDRPALTVLLGLPVAVDGRWDGGSLSGSAGFDRPLSARLAAVFIAGAARGIAVDLPHEEAEANSTYLVAGLRATAHPEDTTRLYLLAALGLLRADLREQVSGYPLPETLLVRSSSTGTTALFAAGAIAAIPRSRCSVVLEASYLVPWTSAPGHVGGKVPSPLLATAGLRIALGR